MAGWNDIWQTLQQVQQSIAGIAKLLTNGVTITPAPGAATTLTGAVTGTGTGTIATTFEAIPALSFLGNLGSVSAAAASFLFGPNFINSGGTLDLTGVVTAAGDFLRINAGTIYSGGQITLTATTGGTFTVTPTIGYENYFIKGPSAGGIVTLALASSSGISQKIVMNISQGATAATWNFPTSGAGFNFSSSLPPPTITATAGKRDNLVFINNVGTVFDFEAITQGFSP